MSTFYLNSGGECNEIQMSELMKIHEYLISSGWEDCEYGQYLSEDRQFKIFVAYDDYYCRFIVRSAIFPLFDRWANSGAENYFNTADETMKFLRGSYVAAALEEIITVAEDGVDESGDIDEDTYNFVSGIISLATERN